MSQCAQCQEVTSPDSKFCPACGASSTPAESKTCSKCQTVLSPGAKFCENCGEESKGPKQAPKKRPRRPSQESSNGHYNLLLALCIFTILGSLIILLLSSARVLFELAPGPINGRRIHDLGILKILTSIGTLVGASFMIKKEKFGLYIYTIAQAIFLVAGIYEIVEVVDDGDPGLIAFMALLGPGPGIVFLAMYWTGWCRKNLS